MKNKTIEQLIADLCPDGVEYKKLGEIFSRKKGTPITATQMKQIESKDGEIRIFAGGKTMINAHLKDIPNPNIISEPAVLVQSRGVIDVVYYEMPFTFKNEMWAYTCKNKTTLKYLYYFLKQNIQRLRDKATSMGAFPQISIPDTEELEIPVPPIDVQERIVEVLDTFTSLISELQDELQTRKQQYDFYRNKLLSFNNNKNIEYKNLNEIFELRNGYTPSKNNEEFWEYGTIPWFRMEDIRLNGRILSDSIQHITPKAIKGKGLFKAKSFILATTATIGEHAMLIVDSLANQQFTNLKVRKSLEDKILSKYIFHYLFIIDDWCKNNVNSSSFASVDMGKLSEYKFPIPPLSEQQRIVDILDKFEELVNDKEHGLPAEIEARQKQYEYYRDKLLTFKRK